jgi:protein tyrosine phosphatase (PTP) superfamily phosphohydrolase (DUF442 family)
MIVNYTLCVKRKALLERCLLGFTVYLCRCGSRSMFTYDLVNLDARFQYPFGKKFVD